MKNNIYDILQPIHTSIINVEKHFRYTYVNNQCRKVFRIKIRHS